MGTMNLITQCALWPTRDRFGRQSSTMSAQSMGHRACTGTVWMVGASATVAIREKPATKNVPQETQTPWINEECFQCVWHQGQTCHVVVLLTVAAASHPRALPTSVVWADAPLIAVGVIPISLAGMTVAIAAVEPRLTLDGIGGTSGGTISSTWQSMEKQILVQQAQIFE